MSAHYIFHNGFGGQWCGCVDLKMMLQQHTFFFRKLLNFLRQFNYFGGDNNSLILLYIVNIVSILLHLKVIFILLFFEPGVESFIPYHPGNTLILL